MRYIAHQYIWKWVLHRLHSILVSFKIINFWCGEWKTVCARFFRVEKWLNEKKTNSNRTLIFSYLSEIKWKKKRCMFLYWYVAARYSSLNRHKNANTHKHTTHTNAPQAISIRSHIRIRSEFSNTYSLRHVDTSRIHHIYILAMIGVYSTFNEKHRLEPKSDRAREKGLSSDQPNQMWILSEKMLNRK